MSRVTAVLRNAAKEAKPAPLSNDHTKYHQSPQGFWKKFHRAMVVNPNISSGLPLPTENRFIQPASRPEKYATPATMASDIAFNPYWKRDTRRAYPQTSFITQEELSALLLESPAISTIAAPETKTEVPTNSSSLAPAAENAETVVAASQVPALSTVLAELPVGKAFVGAGITTGTEGNTLPPTPPRLSAKWQPRSGEDIPHDPHAYFPVFTVT